MAHDSHEPGMLTRAQRIGLFAGMICVTAGFLAAASIQPDPRGFGSHQQFGLPPCSFYTLFGIPCPSCGGTTCAAYFVRGRWIAAVCANPAVFGLMLTSTTYLPWAAVCLVRRELWGVSDPGGVAVWVMIGLSALAVVQWSFRILLF